MFTSESRNLSVNNGYLSKVHSFCRVDVFKLPGKNTRIIILYKVVLTSKQESWTFTHRTRVQQAETLNNDENKRVWHYTRKLINGRYKEIKDHRENLRVHAGYYSKMIWPKSWNVFPAESVTLYPTLLEDFTKTIIIYMNILMPMPCQSHISSVSSVKKKY